MNKVVASSDEAIPGYSRRRDPHARRLWLVRHSENLIRALIRKGVKNLNTISNNMGVDGHGMGDLLAAGQIAHRYRQLRRGEPPARAVVAIGKLEVNLIPQGTFSERIRAGGAGIPGFRYSRRRRHSLVAEGKETPRIRWPSRRDRSGRSPLISRSSEPGRVTNWADLVLPQNDAQFRSDDGRWS